MAPKLIRGATVGAVSALALAAAGQASAMDFQAGDTNVSIYGYTIGKVSYDIDSNLGDATGAGFSGLSSSTDDDADGYSDVDASQSRIGVRTATAVGGSDLVTRVEGDFRGGSGGPEFRLRHAYGSWNGILAGQTWSNYNSFVGSTPTIDFNSVAGNAGYQVRLAQVRYTVGGFSVAVEDPKTTIRANNAGTTPPGGDPIAADATAAHKDSLPAVSLRYEGSAGNFGYSASAIARQIETVDESDDATGYGGFLAASYDLGAFSVQGAVNYIDGAGSYLYLSGAPDAYEQSNGDIETISGWGGTLGVSVDAGPGSINLAYGRTEIDDADEVPGDVDETRQNAFLNYFWSPVDRVTYGIEYAWLKAEDESGNSGDGSRVAFAAQYVF